MSHIRRSLPLTMGPLAGPDESREGPAATELARLGRVIVARATSPVHDAFAVIGSEQSRFVADAIAGLDQTRLITDALAGIAWSRHLLGRWKTDE